MIQQVSAIPRLPNYTAIQASLMLIGQRHDVSVTKEEEDDDDETNATPSETR
jgi:hypothetical protein